MPIELPKDLDAATLEAARAAFAEACAARDLAAPDVPDAPVTPATGTAPRPADLISGEATPAGPIPIGLLRLRRHLARAHARAISPAARAAHGGDDIARSLGAYHLRLIDEGDLVFLTITASDGAPLPEKLDAFVEDEARHLRLALPEAVGETVMLGLDPESEFGKDVLDILGRTGAEILLS